MEQPQAKQTGIDALELYADLVYRVAASQVKNRFDADDVFQEVFLRYFRKPRAFDSEEHRKAWLIRVTLNCCKRFWASPWRRTQPLSDAFSFEDPEEYGLYEVLLTLPAKYRAVLELFYFEDLPVAQISSILQLKPPAVRMRLTRGRALMKEKLKGEYFDEASNL